MKKIIAKKLVFIILLVILFLLFILFISGANSSALKSIENKNNESKTRVIINLRNERQAGYFKISKIKLTEEEKGQTKEKIVSRIGKENIRHDFGGGFSAELSEEELEVLKEDYSVEIIKMNTLQLFLQDSTGIVNATSTWPVQVNGINLTGQDETVCIIDTGVNFSHPDLRGKNLTCNVNCITQNCVENCSISDDHGHGTHVAGIVAANGSIKGIAPNAKIVSLKVLDSDGGGSPDDLKLGIDWCINKALTYNISVISLSLGCNATKDGYTSYCDSAADGCLSSQLAVSINNATSRNISVIAATGNYANFSAIASPACVQNATAVAASDKSDNLWNYNRNSLTDLLAPGISITSTSISGSYVSESGTSMAAPHVAAAFALVRQFKKLEKNQILKPSEIQQALNNTGKRINDASSGLNFSRVDIYSAILSLDETSPNITLIQPTHNILNSSQNYTFKCNATDLQLKNITLYIWNSSALYYTAIENASGTFAEREFNLTNMPIDIYKWNCLAYDTKNNKDYASSNFSLTVGSMSVTLVSPENNSFANSPRDFTCNATTLAGTSLTNITFYLWNSSSSINITTTNISGTQNSTNLSYNFTQQQEYKWNCLAINNESSKTFAESNFTITYDVALPAIALLSPENNTTNSTTNTIDFYYNASDTNSIANCSLIINNNINKTISSPARSILNNISVYLANAVYNWSINCTDAANNQNVSQTRILTVQYTPPQSQQPSGGSSASGGAGATYSISEKQFLEGYTSMLSTNDKIKFNVSGKTHILELNETTNSSAKIKLSSDEIIIILLLNETKKFDLNSDNYYDLQVRLNEIKNKKANLTIIKINELIRATENKGEEKENKTNKIIAFNETKLTENSKKNSGVLIFILVIVLGIILIIMVFLVISTKKDKKRKRSKKQKNDR